MPPRSRLPDLAKLFDSLDDPIYVVDDRRRLIFVNDACAAWLGRSAEELLGRDCRYRTTVADDDPIAAAADALCPPPSSSLGRASSGEVVAPSGDVRRAEFMPLGVTPTGAAAVLAWLPAPQVVETLADDDRRRESEAQRLHAVAARLRRDLATRYAPERLIGVSPAMARVRKQIALAAQSDANVAIVGPAGIGKGHVARTIHALRAATLPPTDAAPLVPLDGPTLHAELLQSTIRSLARTAREAGRRGDLVIHDVDRMPVDAQIELAGFLRLVDLPMRLVVTARESLDVLVQRGSFPADLASWLTTLVVELPALAKRPEDVPPLAQFFVEDSNAAGDARQLGGFTTDALDRIAQYAWPGNVAELAETVAECCTKAEGPLIGVDDLPRRIHAAADAARYAPRADAPIVLDDYLAEIEKELLRRAMARSRGNKTKAAGLLGMTRPRLYRRLVQLGLEAGPIVFEQSGEDDDSATP